MHDNFTVAVFCGSTLGKREIYKEKTEELGREMLKRNVSLVYGGGNRGLMGVLAHTVYYGGGNVTGVLPEAMNISSVTDGAVSTKMIIARDMHERKSTMYSLSDAVIALPGGIGTLEELSEIYTWRQLGYSRKNIALFNINGYYTPFLKQLDTAVEEGFLMPAVRDILIVSDDASYILDHLQEDSMELPSKL